MQIAVPFKRRHHLSGMYAHNFSATDLERYVLAHIPYRWFAAPWSKSLIGCIVKPMSKKWAMLRLCRGDGHMRGITTGQQDDASFVYGGRDDVVTRVQYKSTGVEAL